MNGVSIRHFLYFERCAHGSRILRWGFEPEISGLNVRGIVGVQCSQQVGNLAPHLGHVSNFCGLEHRLLEPGERLCSQEDPSRKLLSIQAGLPVWTPFEFDKVTSGCRIIGQKDSARQFPNTRFFCQRVRFYSAPLPGRSTLRDYSTLSVALGFRPLPLNGAIDAPMAASQDWTQWEGARACLPATDRQRLAQDLGSRVHPGHEDRVRTRHHSYISLVVISSINPLNLLQCMMQGQP